MGKLNIAHHKSYHPYRQDNIARVRRDEAEARAQTEIEEGRAMVADSEARMDMLRQKAGAEGKEKGKEKERLALEDGGGELAVEQAGSSSSLVSAQGHINLFQDVEQKAITHATRPTKKPSEVEQGFPLAPPAKDLKPWYSDREHKPEGEVNKDRRHRDLARQSKADPLTFINRELTRRHPSSHSSSHPLRRPKSNPSNPTSTSNSNSALSSRLTRESSERARARALLARKKRELEGTPSTVRGDEREGGYGDVFNRVEVEEARRRRGWGERGW